MNRRPRTWQGAARRYPRMARVNELLREVLAEEIEESLGSGSRSELLTVTAVQCDADLRHATVLMASLSEEAATILGEARPRLQAAIARQVRLKRTPQLVFAIDPTIAHGEKVESIIRAIHEAEAPAEGGTEAVVESRGADEGSGDGTAG